MIIFIVGSGEIGTHIAKKLSNNDHEVVVFELNEERINELSETLDIKVINQDGSSANSLINAGIEDCELFFAVTSDNNINLVSCSIAKKLGVPTVICRVHSTLLLEEKKFNYKGNFNIDYIFSPERLSAVELAKYIRNPEYVMVEEIARGQIEMQNINITNKSKILGKSLREIKLPDRVRIGAITSNHKARIPNADDIILENDILTIFSTTDNINNAFSAFGIKHKTKIEKNIVIFSGSDYGFSLSQILEGFSDVKVRILEKNVKKCEELSRILKKTTIINADATSMTVLKEENIGEADFFIACSLQDEDNVMSCIQAQNIGTKHCLTLIHRADYADAIRSSVIDLGIIGAVSPRETTIKELSRFVTTQKYQLIKDFRGGEIIEFTLSINSPIINKKISDVNWPKSCIIVALIHETKSTIPSPNDDLYSGDTLYAVIDKSSKKDLLKLI